MIKSVAKFLFILFHSFSFKKAIFFYHWEGVTNRKLLQKVDIVKEGIVHMPTGKIFSKVCLWIFNNSLSLFERMVQTFDAEEKDGKICLDTIENNKRITAFMANHESLLCMEEVFSYKTYGFTAIHPTVVIDVGANIGLTALYFASFNMVSKVYAFELVHSTAKFAQLNIQSNKFAEEKIVINHMGVGDRNEWKEIPVTGAGDVGASIQMIRDGAETENVSIADICTLIDEIRSQHKNDHLVIKLDCEGEEYAILERLDGSTEITEISAFLIEWHKLGSAKLVDILERNGFFCFNHLIPAHQPTGFIYAKRESVS